MSFLSSFLGSASFFSSRSWPTYSHNTLLKKLFVRYHVWPKRASPKGLPDGAFIQRWSSKTCAGSCAELLGCSALAGLGSFLLCCCILPIEERRTDAGPQSKQPPNVQLQTAVIACLVVMQIGELTLVLTSHGRFLLLTFAPTLRWFLNLLETLYLIPHKDHERPCTGYLLYVRNVSNAMFRFSTRTRALCFCGTL